MPEKVIRRFHTLSARAQVARARDLEGTPVLIVTHEGRRPVEVYDTYEGVLVAVAVPAGYRGRPLLVVADPRRSDPVAITTYWITEVHAAEGIDRA